MNTSITSTSENPLCYFLDIDSKRLNNETLFPLCRPSIPIDLVKSILLELLLASESAKMMQLNVTWHHLIVTDNKIYKNYIFFASCIAEAILSAKLLKDYKEQSKVFCDIARIDPLHDLCLAKVAAAKIDDVAWYQNSNGINQPPPNMSMDEAYSEIAKVEAQYNPVAVNDTLQKIQNIAHQLNAFFETVTIVVHHDLPLAKEIAKGIPNPYKQSCALIEILKVEVKHNLVEARQTASQLSDTFKLHAYLELATNEPLYDLTEVRECVGELENEKLMYAVLLAAPYDLNLAKEIAETIQDTECQGLAYEAIVKVEVLKDLPQAKLTVEKISNLESKVRAALEIAKNDPEYLVYVKKLISNLSHHSSRAELYFETVKVEVLHDLHAAKQTAKKIKNTFCESNAYLEILKVEVHRDLIQAKKTVKKIKESKIRSRALLEIARVEAVNDPIKAKKTIESIDDFSIKVDAYKVIEKDSNQRKIIEVKECAQNDLTLAKKSIEEIENLALQAYAFLEVAKIAFEK